MTADHRHVVVVGAGLGGVRTVEHLRREGFAGPITVVGAEHHPPYDRPPLTKQVLRGEQDSTPLRGEWASLGADLRLGVSATALDGGARRLSLDDGTRLGYDVAVLAPGATPRSLPGSTGRPGLHTVRTIDDALALRAGLIRSRSVVVVGGGFVGCEVAASARAHGASVALVEVLPAPLTRVLGAAAASLVTDLHHSHGVRVHAGVAVAEILGNGRVEGVVLADGTRLDSPEVVVGLGVTPNVAWLAGSGIELADGIRCTSAGRTSLPDVYAVGDAAEWWHPLAGAHRRVEHWTSTADQARVVAAAITGAPDPVLAEVPYFWSDQYDVKIQALGFVDPDDDVEILHPGGRPVLLYSRHGVLRAVVGFSAARWIMRLRTHITNGSPTSEAAALLA